MLRHAAHLCDNSADGRPPQLVGTVTSRGHEARLMLCTQSSEQAVNASPTLHRPGKVTEQ